jgi:hypothetical protein
MTFAPDQKLQLRSDDVVWREDDGELVVFELSTTTYLTLNGTARQLWGRLSEGATSDELIGSLLEAHPISRDQASADVHAFLASLVERDLIDQAP